MTIFVATLVPQSSWNLDDLSLARMRILKIATAAWQLVGATGVLADDKYPPDPTHGWWQRHTVTDRPRPEPVHDFDHRGMKKLRQAGDRRGGHDFNRTYLTEKPCIWEDSHYWTSW